MTDPSRRFSRREALSRAALTAATLHLTDAAPVRAAPTAPPDSPEPETLRWIGGAAQEMVGVTWGTPWPRGVHRPETTFSLVSAEGASVPLQTWPLAFWPDGSLKWTGHAISGAGTAPGTEKLRLVSGQSPAAPPHPVTVQETAAEIFVDTGMVRYRIARKGPVLIPEILRSDGGRTVARNVRLVCLRRSSPEITEDGGNAAQERFDGVVTEAIIEQKGPVRAVVCLKGMHKGQNGKDRRSWLPFTVRLYFYAGSEALRLMHTFVFDGDAQQDFLSGLGVRFDVPLSADPLTDRHVRFAGADSGVWGEAVRGLTGLRRDPGADVRAAQVAGRKTPPPDRLPQTVGGRLSLIPAWGDYTLFQPNADGFEIRKRTAPGHAWIRAGAGRRAGGFAYLGGATGGGLAFGMRDFWQRHPAQIDVRNAASADRPGEATLWLWSPDVPPMDLRFYHDGMGMKTHEQEREGLEITYEDYEQGWGTPHGIARTSELFFWTLPATPTHERFAALARAAADPPQIVASPQTLHTAEVFANWSPTDRSHPVRRAIEDQLDYLLNLYLGQIEQRRWYGFWDYGDVMHSYDGDRHEWRYDVGGFAWANSELSPDLWLWYSFLRSGRADVYRLTEAMTRHTSEVDVYHLGRFRGTGSRHNVQHWGDSSKQPRVSTAAYRRIFYYLTADERTGDILREALDGDYRLKDIDIGRKLRPAGSPPPKETYLSFGTDWCSLAAAWLTEWERTGQTRWRDRLLNGMRSIGALPRGWCAGGSAYDLETGRFLGPGDTVSVSHLNAVFGAVEISAELISLLPVPEYEKAWLLYCEAYNAPGAERDRLMGGRAKDRNLGEAHSRLTAYAAVRTKNDRLASRAWAEFFSGAAGLGVRTGLKPRRVEGPTVLRPVDEGFGMSTNASSQWGLAAIENLALIGDKLPSVLPPPPGGDGSGAGDGG